ncbi:MMPL family transporter [Nocardia sp. NPDC050412]|uniref:MMPL family transporter n=1 Tax=Nocardia sp. NPDC050412 TaxID=3364320 RepID=UPI0037BDA6A3
MGLAIDYGLFIVSRFRDELADGHEVPMAVRGSISTAGRTVMMQYIALGMVTALFIDATVLRMLLVPATMKLLGDACWWAPAWPRRIQRNAVAREPVTDSAAAMPTASRSESDPTSV